jgi:hypothetical protein
MKIYVVTRVWSFIEDTINIWKYRGDTVIKSHAYDKELAKKADIIFFEFIDEQLLFATLCPIGKTKIIIARLHRIEYYLNIIGKLTRANINWDAVNYLIITGEYFYKKIISGIEKKFIGNKCNIVHYRYGVDEIKYTFKERKGIRFENSAKIGWLAKNYDSRKNPIKALSCFKAIDDKYSNRNFKTEFYMAAGGGTRHIDGYWDYLRLSQDFVRNRVIKNRWQGNVNNYLEPMNYFLNTSSNESFCFVIAEACLKGIKPLIWDFEPANTIWPREWTFFTDQEMFDIMESSYDSKKYREYIIDNFSIAQQIKNFDKLIK